MAWTMVARNQGARTTGIDGVTVHQIEQRGEVLAFLSEIAAAIEDGSYRPAPVRRVFIPKPSIFSSGPVTKVTGCRLSAEVKSDDHGGANDQPSAEVQAQPHRE
jgi:hypothetical protein